MKEQEYIKEQEGEVERIWAEMTQKEYEAKVRKTYRSNMHPQLYISKLHTESKKLSLFSHYQTFQGFEFK